MVRSMSKAAKLVTSPSEGEQGWTSKWETHDGREMAGEPGQERMAAEMLTRALVELHGLETPSTLSVFVRRQSAEGSA